MTDSATAIGGGGGRNNSRQMNYRYTLLNGSKTDTILRAILCKTTLIQSIFWYSILLIVFSILYFTIAYVKYALNTTCPDIPSVDTAEIAEQLKKEPKNVAILVTGTGKYAQLAMELVDSGRQYFCRGNNKECLAVTYIVFTDVPKEQLILSAGPEFTKDHHVVFIHQQRRGWPDDSMKRFHSYLKQKETLEMFDFIISMDADLRFIDHVELSELYSDLTAILHPGYTVTNRWDLPFERKEPRSKAFVPAMASCRYFTAAIWAGEREHFIRALRTLVWQLDSDAELLGVNFTAAWHDESHLNRYFVDNHPSRILLPTYYYPEDVKMYPMIYKPILNIPQKILAVRKNQQLMRNE